MITRAGSPAFAAGRRRVAAPTIVYLGALLVAGPLLGAVLLDRGHTMRQAVGLGVLLQVVAALGVPGNGPRTRRWLTGLAYATFSWALVAVLLHVFRSSDICDTTLSVGTLDNARLVVMSAGALVAVVAAFAIAAATRLPHAAVVVLVAAAFALPVVLVPRLDALRVVDAWQTLGSHYLSNDRYSTVCGKQVNLETAPARPAVRR